jgi:hypothetical protein
MKKGIRFDLLAQIGRRAQQMPRAAIRAHGHLDLTARLGAQGTLAEPAAIITIAIPLRKSAAGRCAEYTHQHPRFQPVRRN